MKTESYTFASCMEGSVRIKRRPRILTLTEGSGYRCKLGNMFAIKISLIEESDTALVTNGAKRDAS